MRVEIINITEMKYDDTIIEKNWLTIVKSDNIW